MAKGYIITFVKLKRNCNKRHECDYGHFHTCSYNYTKNTYKYEQYKKCTEKLCPVLKTCEPESTVFSMKN